MLLLLVIGPWLAMNIEILTKLVALAHDLNIAEFLSPSLT